MTVHLHHRTELQRVARKAMIDRGLQPDFDAAVSSQLNGIRGPATMEAGAVRDLRGLLWCSIDNDDSLDLDQLSVAEDRGGGMVNILIAVADVDALVAKGTPIDQRAASNTASVYVAGRVYPMLRGPRAGA